MPKTTFLQPQGPACGIGATEFRQRFGQYLSPQLLGAERRARFKRKQRSDTKVSDAGMIMGRVFHFMQSSGTAAAHVSQVCRKKISESQVSRRCRAMGTEIFEWVMREILGPRADPKREPRAFYRGKRLTGIDGTLFSMSNTPSVLKQISKAVSRRMKAAFAKLGVVALVELGTHRPMAAAIARPGESEMAMARRLIHLLPGACLLLADRLYGVGKFLVVFLKLFAQGDNDFLVRVKRGKFKSKVLERYRDGSALLSVWGTAEDGGKEEILVREICGWIVGRGRKRTFLRLWTSLLDPKMHPARELLELYVQRWEQEICFKELKIHLHGGAPLQSYTPETGRQEIASLLICQAMLADMRLAAARRGAVPVLRVSFLKVLQHVRVLWQFLSWSGVTFSEKQKRQAIAGLFRSLRRELSPPRRARSCPRVVRQPIGSWPRKLKNGGDSHGAFSYEIS